MIKKSIAIVILVLVSMASMANENKDYGKVKLDTSVINVKLEQKVNDRLQMVLTEADSELVKKLEAIVDANLPVKSVNYFKVNTSLPE